MGKKVKIVVVETGQSFGHIGQVRARNNRVLAEGPVRPYGMGDAARRDAEQIALRRGWTIA